MNADERLVTDRLNQFCRRLRQTETQIEWASSLLDAIEYFAPKGAVFSVQGTSLRMEMSRTAIPGEEIPLAGAPAFSGAVASLDPVIAAATPGELSLRLCDILGVSAGPLSYVFPVVSKGKAVAVLYAEGSRESVDGHAIELLATLAGAIWDARAVGNTAVGLVGIQNAPTDAHLRAQRFAQVQIAELRLYRSDEVKQARSERALYATFRSDIDRDREEFRLQFLRDDRSMADYYHVELVRTLANDDPSLLGADYPGPLV
jgi:hypothetical protein